jgi:hypothetical protein
MQLLDEIRKKEEILEHELNNTKELEDLFKKSGVKKR